MPTPSGSRKAYNISINSAATGVAYAVADKAGTIVGAWVGVNAAPTSAVVVLSKNAVNILSATNVDLSGLTANTGASQTLAENPATLRVAAGDILKAASTVTTAGSMTGVACSVVIEPDLW